MGGAPYAPRDLPPGGAGLVPERFGRPSPPQRRAGRPSPGARTRSSSPPPARARRSPPSWPASTTCGSRAARREPRRPRPLRLAAEGAEQRHPPQPRRCRSKASPRRPRAGLAARPPSTPPSAPATRPAAERQRRCRAARRTSSSPRPSRCTCCSPPAPATSCATSLTSSSTRSTPSAPTSAASSCRCCWSAWRRSCATPPFVRIGLSATQRPLDEVARYLGGRRRRRAAPSRSSTPGLRKDSTCGSSVPSTQFGPLPEQLGLAGDLPAAGAGRRPPVDDRLRQQPPARSSGIAGQFLNARRARVCPGAPRQRRPGGAGSEIEEALKEGRLPAVCATASLELGIDMGAVDLVCQVESPGNVAPRPAAGRAGRAPRRARRQGAALPKTPGDLLETAVLVRGDAPRASSRRSGCRSTAWTCWRSSSSRMAAMDDWPVDDLFALVRRAYRYRDLTERQLHGVLEMLAGRYPRPGVPGAPARIVWDREAGVIRGRRAPAPSRCSRAAPSPTGVSTRSTWKAAT